MTQMMIVMNMTQKIQVQMMKMSKTALMIVRLKKKVLQKRTQKV